MALSLTMWIVGCGSPDSSKENGKDDTEAGSGTNDDDHDADGDDHEGHDHDADADDHEGHDEDADGDDHAGHDHGPGGHDHGADADAAKIEAALAKLSADDLALAQKQKICPVSKEALGGMDTPIKVTVAGRDVFICCQGCEEELRKNPDKYLANISE